MLNIFKSFFTSSTVKKYQKAGFLNEDLTLTSERGVKAVNRVIFEKFEAELIALADAQIAEDKEEKCG